MTARAHVNNDGTDDTRRSRDPWVYAEGRSDNALRVFQGLVDMRQLGGDTFKISHSLNSAGYGGHDDARSRLAFASIQPNSGKHAHAHVEGEAFVSYMLTFYWIVVIISVKVISYVCEIIESLIDWIKDCIKAIPT